ncbi:MAG: 3-hydroxyacyl-CoA dehydrogenase/enoyl-CoA hydratase family protein [Deltaproteobacteria bacterium]|nr:3-hydroxyacyl-CoA dehydrogenase/enoyl-CoA hydratase family protein [Deltaproteobacteria bacterium]
MRVGVIGSGSIGPDLAYGFVSALAGTGTVYLMDIKQEALDAGVKRIQGYVGKGVARGRLSPKAAEGIRAALKATQKLEDLADCDYVLEAATEDLKIKKVILKSLEAVVRPDCLIGFATSGIPRVQIAAEARHPDRCFVNHPFFPAWRSLPIEVVLSPDARLGARMVATLEQLGKVPVITADVECFAADDVFCNYISEAARIAAEGVATPAQVDRIVNDAIGGGGPFNVMDGTRGNLLTVHCQELMRGAPGGTAWFAPPAILKEQAAKAWHDPQHPGDQSYPPALGAKVLDRILAVLLGRTYAVIENKVCDPADMDWLTRNALGFTDGLVEVGERLGAARVAELCQAYAAAHPGFPVPKCVAEKKLPEWQRDIRVERDGDIAVVTVRRPEVKNALCKRAIGEIRATFERLAADPSVAGVVFTSFGGALAGADINELASLKTAADCENICLEAHPVQALVSGFKKPVVAALDGPVMGGGAEFSMACHARVVGPNLLLAQPEVNLGIVPGYGGTQRLPRLIGLEHALDLLRTGRAVGAKEACAWGWAHGEPVADPVAAAKDLIRQHHAGKVKLAPVDPKPVPVPAQLPALDLGHHSLTIDAILVDVVRTGLARPLNEGLAIEAAGFGRCKATVDMDIGLKNFTQNGPRVPAAFLHE